MNRSNTSIVARAVALALASGLCTAAWADDSYDDLRHGQWTQWAFSIPASVNPLVDTTGQNCMVGQSGSVWYLGPGLGPVTASRSCTIPQGVKLQVAVAGGNFVDTPGFCGQGPTPTPLSDMRAVLAAFTDTLQVNVTLNGQRVKTKRIRSAVFATALPADNLFTLFCGGPGSVPAGVYARSVEDSYYAEIERLPVGTHTLQLVASDGGSFNQNIVYTLTVVPRDRR